jgi:hypothetical protein
MPSHAIPARLRRYKNAFQAFLSGIGIKLDLLIAAAAQAHIGASHTIFYASDGAKKTPREAFSWESVSYYSHSTLPVSIS